MMPVAAAEDWELLGRWCDAVGTSRNVPTAVLVVAHPDDETIGAGSRLARSGGKITLVHITDGAPRNMRDAWTSGLNFREDYASVRRQELLSALDLCGIAPAQALTLGLVDQEASYRMDGIVESLRQLLTQLRPELILTHAYEGGHPDHDTTAFAVHVACELLKREGRPRPVIAEMTGYFAGTTGMVTGRFLTAGRERVEELSPEQRRFKERLFDCFQTQRKVLQHFSCACERFRLAPAYEFGHAPHEGQLFYEKFDWGVTGAQWRELALATLQRQDISGAV